MRKKKDFRRDARTLLGGGGKSVIYAVDLREQIIGGTKIATSSSSVGEQVVTFPSNGS